MRFHDAATLDEILADVCLEYIKTTEDIEIAEIRSMNFALEHIAKAFGDALSEYNNFLKENASRAWKIKENVTCHPLCRHCCHCCHELKMYGTYSMHIVNKT